ncbi:hypothetical protein ACUIOY_005685, partial [Klebsiella pneumoniae]
YIHISKGNRVFQKVFIYLNGNVFARFDLFYSYMVLWVIECFYARAPALTTGADYDSFNAGKP